MLFALKAWTSGQGERRYEKLDNGNPSESPFRFVRSNLLCRAGTPNNQQMEGKEMESTMSLLDVVPTRAKTYLQKPALNDCCKDHMLSNALILFYSRLPSIDYPSSGSYALVCDLYATRN